MELMEFLSGKAFDAYMYFGAHIYGKDTVFRVYAPAAEKVGIEGDFNDWKEEFMFHEGKGVYSIITDKAKEGMRYLFCIYDRYGKVTKHTDPFAFGMEIRPYYAAVIRNLGTFQFSDWDWMKNRNINYDRPMNIYEVHLGSWRRKSKEEYGWYRYTEIIEQLIAYVKENGYTHIEFLPLSEHPFDGSWGYQVTGFFAPTSRYGVAQEVKMMVNRCHQEGIGVIIDFVPVHFALDEYGLREFDGTPLYEYPSKDIGYSEWGSCNFNLYRGEVQSFLQSVAEYWINEYHFDGIRMDAVSNLLYWQGNSDNGVNAGGVNFIKQLNRGLKKRHPDVMLIAEDSTIYPKVTFLEEEGGLGFDYKWDLGWMHDTLEVFSMHPKDRVEHYHKLTFSMAYFYSEHFLLPFSHDEVVHGKASLLQKMWGDFDTKLRQYRVLCVYMYTHPGKKLDFMGNEIGQLGEWNEGIEVEWNSLEDWKRKAFQRFHKTINYIYKESPALHIQEYEKESFEWIQADCKEQVIYCYKRSGYGQTMYIVINLSENYYQAHSVLLEKKMIWKEILSSNSNWYGGDKEDRSGQWMEACVVSKKEKILKNEEEVEEVKEGRIKEKGEREEYEMLIELEPLTAKIYEVVK